MDKEYVFLEVNYIKECYNGLIIHMAVGREVKYKFYRKLT
jgi:hypothetical protein